MVVVFRSSIPGEECVAMSKSGNPSDLSLKLKQINQFHRNKKVSSPNHLNIPACDQSRYAVIDVVILVAVVCACGVLLHPYATALTTSTLELADEVLDVLSEEISDAPLLFGCLGLSIVCAVTALVAILVSTDRRCGKPGCRGLHNAAEFDIQLETQDCVRKSNFASRTSLRRGLFELPHDHHRELEAELKKMAPPNGRAVLVFRARCGCPVGTMEVPCPRKSRKVKK